MSNLQGTATEATAIGWGGISAVAQATGLSRNTILAGIRDIQHPQLLTVPDEFLRVRQPGGGRKPLSETDRRLERDFEKLLAPSILGDACRRTERPKRGRTTRIGTLSSSTSTGK